MIKLLNVSKSFGDNKVLDSVNLNVNGNESLVILGGSGSGKSVLIKIIVGLMKKDSGQIFLDNIELNSEKDYLENKILENFGFLFQSNALFDSLTVLDNIVFQLRKIKNFTKKQLIEFAKEKLEQVGLNANIVDSYPSELSGGMQKRVALARAIAHNPKVIFLDEPTSGLDPVMSNVINELIIKVREELGATAITITHDVGSAKMIATKIAFLYNGNINCIEKPKNLFNSQNQKLDDFVHGRIR
jgi:phospholipid/cholesterol/gamma-HCH transport system ATP-binding protein